MKLPAYVRLEKSGTVLLELWIQPGAARSGFAGRHGERLKIRLAAPPVDGRANRQLLKFLAAQLGLSRGRLELVAGARGRGKTVRVSAPLDFLSRLPADEP